ncbi:MAG: hypothetical protein JNL08_18010 [Planctomycetes bacterium]|nr:hypothetical protein [Planctomycetota bacterium]
MAGPRRSRPPLPNPPPLGAIVVDGSNVIASSQQRPIERLDLVLAWCREWRPDLPVMVFVDLTTARRCRPDAQAVLRARCEDVAPQRPRYAVVPFEAMPDAEILRFAREHRGLVISNDRFFDHDELRRGVLTVQFTLAGDQLVLADEATWFRPSGGAQRVPMADLRQPPLPPDDRAP